MGKLSMKMSLIMATHQLVHSKINESVDLCNNWHKTLLWALHFS